MSDIINIIIWIACQIGICICWYQLGKNNGVYKMQIISLSIIGDLGRSMVKYVINSDGLDLSDEQSKMIQNSIYDNTVIAMDNIPDVRDVNKIFKNYQNQEKEEEKEENGENEE